MVTTRSDLIINPLEIAPKRVVSAGDIRSDGITFEKNWDPRSALNGLSLVPRDLDIGGTLYSPDCFYLGQDAITTDLPAEIGQNLDIDTGSLVVDKPAPFDDPTASFELDGSSFLRSNDTSYLNPGTNDFLFRFVFRTLRNASIEYVMGTPSAHGAQGWDCRLADSGPNRIFVFYVKDAANPLKFISTIVQVGEWYCIQGSYKAGVSGEIQLMRNALQGATPVAVASYGSLDSATDFTMGAEDNGTDNCQVEVAHFSFYQGAGMLASADPVALGQKFIAQIFGLLPKGGSFGGETTTFNFRSSRAMIETFKGGVRDLHMLGRDAPRVQREKDGLGREVGGVRREDLFNQYITHTADLTNASWTKTGVTITANDIQSPYVDEQADAIKASSTGSAVRKIGAAEGTTGNDRTISALIKPGVANKWLLSGGTDKGVWVDLSTLTVEQTGTDVQKAFLIPDWRNGFVRVVALIDNAAVSLECGPVDSAGGTTYNAADTSSILGHVTELNFTNTKNPRVIVHNETGSTIAKAADVLAYDGANVFPVGQGTIEVEVVHDGGTNGGTVVHARKNATDNVKVLATTAPTLQANDSSGVASSATGAAFDESGKAVKHNAGGVFDNTAAKSSCYTDNDGGVEVGHTRSTPVGSLTDLYVGATDTGGDVYDGLITGIRARSLDVRRPNALTRDTFDTKRRING